MKCLRCENAEATTNGTLAFTKPVKSLAGKIPEDVSGEFCDPCKDHYFYQYNVIYRPEYISRAEAIHG